MKTKDFPKADLQALVWDEAPETYKQISDEITDTSRWSVHHYMVFEFDGRFYGTSYSVGATEHQDERPYEYEPDMVGCHELVPVEKTIISYEPVL